MTESACSNTVIGSIHQKSWLQILEHAYVRAHYW